MFLPLMVVFEAVALLFLFLALLGVMREIMILRGEVKGLTQLITDPPGPSFLQSELPADVAGRLDLRKNGAITQPNVALFVTPGCGGCTELLKALATAVKAENFPRSAVRCVLSASTQPNDPLHKLASQAAGRTIWDSEGELFKRCEIRGTPTGLVINRRSLEVIDYTYGPDVQWVKRAVSAGGSQASNAVKTT